MEYTKQDLLKMRKKLYDLVLLEKRYNAFTALTRMAAIGLGSGSAISLCLYLEKLISGEKALTGGTACLVTSGMFALASNFVGKESKAISDELFEYELGCPDALVDEVYDSVYRR